MQIYKLLNVILVPAILIWIGRWSSMYPEYSGLHTSEWGYLFISVVAIVAGIVMWPHYFAAKNGSRNANKEWQYFLSLGLYTTTAFAIGKTMFLPRSENPDLFIFQLSSVMFIVFSLTRFLNGSHDRRKVNWLDGLSIKVAFLGLVFWILMFATNDWGTLSATNISTIDIASHLGPRTRDLLIGLEDPLFYCGLISLLAANILVLTRSVISVILGKTGVDLPMAIQMVLIILFPTVFALQFISPQFRELSGESSELWQPLGLYGYQGLLSVVLIFLALMLMRKGSPDGLMKRPKSFLSQVVTVGLIVSAAYWITPAMYGPYGRLESEIFETFIIVYVLSSLAYFSLARQMDEPSGKIHTASLLALLSLLFVALSAAMEATGLHYYDSDGEAFTIGDIRVLIMSLRYQAYDLATVFAGLAMLLATWQAVYQRRLYAKPNATHFHV